MIAMDEGHGAAFAACFTKDAQCDVSLTGASAVGTDELANLAVAIKQRFHPARHWEGNVTINQDGVNGETATNVSYWKALNGEETISTGIHLDTLRNENGEWLIEKREIKHTWTKECGHIET